MNVFLTGGSGFIGKNIIEQLSGSHNIIAPTHSDLDLLDQYAVEQFFKIHNIDIVIHAANVGIYDATSLEKDMIVKNVQVFNNLAGQLNASQRMIFLGSGAEYDKRREIKQITEDKFGESVPGDDYGFAKYVCSKYIESTQNIINLRCFSIYGPGEDRHRFLSSAIIDILENRPITIRQNVYFDFLYVDDLVNIINYFIAHQPKHKFYNAVSGNRIDLVTLAGMVEKITGSKNGIVVEQDGLGKEYTADNSQLLSEISDLKFTGFEAGIKKLWNYLKKNDSQIRESGVL